MSINYNSLLFEKRIPSEDFSFPTKNEKSVLKVFLTLFIALLGVINSNGQTERIIPLGDGGFENGNTLNANNWLAITSATANNFYVGTASTPSSGTNAAYISNDGGVTNAMATPFVNSIPLFYRDISIPTNEISITLKFKYKSGGSAADAFGNRSFPVAYYTTNLTAPTPDTTPAGATALNLSLFTNNTYVQAIFSLPSSLAGQTVRLYFGYISAAGSTPVNVNPPVSFDDISLTSRAPMTFTSVTSGVCTDNSTWGTSDIPGTYDDIVIATTHVVTTQSAAAAAADTNGNTTYTFKNLTVNGTFNLNNPITITNNLIINTGSRLNSYSYAPQATSSPGYKGKALSVGGNLTIDGILDASIGAAANITLNGSTVQTVSGTGSFVNVIRALNFYNTATTYPNINWNINATISGTVTFGLSSTSPVNRVQIGNGYKLTSGSPALTPTADPSVSSEPVTGTAAVSAAAGSVTINTINTSTYNASGFLSGSAFVRYLLATGSTTAINPGTDPTTGGIRYPFVSPDGVDRSMYITRTNTTGALAGSFTVVYNNANTSPSTVSIDDTSVTPSYTVQKMFQDSSWTVTGDFAIAPTNTYTVAVMDQYGVYVGNNGAARLMHSSAVLSGAHQAGSITPSVMRNTVSHTDLINGAIYVGINTADEANVTTINNGDTGTIWSEDSNWSKGTVPTCNDYVVILNGANYVIGDSQNCKGILINNGGSLIMPGNFSALNVGCTLNNNYFINNGSFSMTNAGAALTVNGYMTNSNLSSFTQSGGNIYINGNDGSTTNSVPAGTSLLAFNFRNGSGTTLSLTGGTIQITNPHAATSGNTNFALFANIANGTDGVGIDINATTGHTFIFGNGSNTVAGGQSAYGYYVELNGSSTKYMTLGNIIINTNGGTNRDVVFNSANFGIGGNLTVNANGKLQGNANKNIFVAGNIINDGIINTTGTGSFNLANYMGALLGAQPTSKANQTISGTGSFNNASSAPTGNFTTFVLNNTSGSDINWTSSSDLACTTALTLTNGILNTNGKLVTLGTSSVAGTLNGGSTSSYIKNGSFARTILSGNATSSFIFFPIGTISAYTPIWLAPSTTSISKFQTIAFDSNAGTGSGITNLSTTRRWEAPMISGTFTDINVKIGDSNLTNTNIPVLGTAADGIYTSAFGSSAIFTSGTPNTLQSSNTVSQATYDGGYLSYSGAPICTGTPVPGDTVANTNNICLGSSVNLSLQNSTSGALVSYAWESSNTLNGTYTPIDGATLSTYTAAPKTPTFYRCKVTCGGNQEFGYSNPIQISFANNIISATSSTRCGAGNIDFTATSDNGNATINWYDAAIGGTSIGTGSPLTKSLASDTTYYAAAETYSTGNFNITTPRIGTLETSSTNGMFFSANDDTTLTSVDFYPATAGNFTFTLYGAAINNDPGPAIATKVFTATQAQVDNANAGIPVTVSLMDLTLVQGATATNTTIPAGSINYSLSVNNVAFRANAGALNLNGYPYINNGFTITGHYQEGLGVNSRYVSLFNWVVNSKITCSSPRVGATAIVNPLPVIEPITGNTNICVGSTTTLSSNTTGGVWTSDNLSVVTIDSSTGMVTANAEGAATIIYTVTINGCSSAVTTTVTTNNFPTVDDINGTTNACVGSTTTLVSNTIGGVWLSDNISIATVDSAGLVSGISAGETTIIYTVTTNGCSSSKTAIVTIKALPEVNAPSQVCIGSTITLSPTSGGNWTSSDDAIAIVNNSGVVTGIAAGNATFTFSNTSTGCSATTTPVTVNALPEVSAPSKICVGSTAILSPISGGNWTSSDNSTATVNNSGMATGIVAGNATFTFTDTTTGCSATTSSVTVNDIPVVSAPSQVCVGSTIALSPTTGGAWTSSDESKATVTNSGIATGVAVGNVTFTFTSDISDCSATTSSVTVNALPIVEPITGNTNVDVNSTTPLASATSGGVWSSDNTAVATVDSSSGVVTGISAGTATIIYTVISNQCIASATTTVTVSNLANDQFDLAKFNYYPNPVKDILNISSDNNIKTVSVYNLLGQELITREINGNLARIDMSELPNASYLVKISSDDIAKTIRVIKQ